MTDSEKENVAQTAERLTKKPEMFSITIGDETYEQAFVPDGWSVHGFEDMLPAPRHIKDRPEFNEPQSFIDYVNEFHNDADTRPRYFADSEKYQILAVMDATASSKPSHQTHVPRLKMFLAREWEMWVEKAGHQMEGKQFARFIENHLSEIVEPHGSTLLEMCRGLRIRVNEDTDIDDTIADGKRTLKYNESTQVQGVANGVVFAFPETLEVNLPVFQHVGAYKFTVRLRWDKNDRNKVVFFYDFVDKKLIEQLAFKQVRDELSETLKLASPIYIGTPQARS